jgi:hypothetical protein
MIKKYKYFIIAALVLIIIYIVWRARKKNTPVEQIVEEKTKSTTATTNTGLNMESSTDAFPLKVGSKGENVKRLQIALNRINSANKITEDGSFGEQTRVKLMATVATTMYGSLAGLTISESQLNAIIQKGNAA